MSNNKEASKQPDTATISTCVSIDPIDVWETLVRLCGNEISIAEAHDIICGIDSGKNTH